MENLSHGISRLVNLMLTVCFLSLLKEKISQKKSTEFVNNKLVDHKTSQLEKSLKIYSRTLVYTKIMAEDKSAQIVCQVDGR